ncbi:acyl carrier protein [Catenulispora sp. GAS73]|uniref:acyl carrier protein n=1 Tax=Catenulispora TaxID=414878 RepID=UPI001892810F|nr:acyl carrier protein [Catenulispora rubra]
MTSHDEIKKFAFEALGEMNYDTADFDGETQLGPAGVDLESLALAELGVRVEERFGIRFSDDELDELASLTIDEFCAAVETRLATPATSA